MCIKDIQLTQQSSQWSSSGNPVAIQCAWNLNPSVHCNATTGEIILVASVLPVVFQWSSSGFPVVFQCVPIMQINTGSPLGYHWVLPLASMVPIRDLCCFLYIWTMYILSVINWILFYMLMIRPLPVRCVRLLMERIMMSVIFHRRLIQNYWKFRIGWQSINCLLMLKRLNSWSFTIIKEW